MTKGELLDRMRRERAAWDALIAQVPEQRIAEPGVQGEWSIKDILAHVATYELWTANQLRLANGGTELASALFSPDDTDETTTEQRNAFLYKQNHDRPLADIRADSALAFRELINAIAALSDAQLNDPSLIGWWNQPALEVVPNQCYEHYQQHRPDIEAWLAKG